jgi:hypothetical protein
MKVDVPTDSVDKVAGLLGPPCLFLERAFRDVVSHESNTRYEPRRVRVLGESRALAGLMYIVKGSRALSEDESGETETRHQRASYESHVLSPLRAGALWINSSWAVSTVCCSISSPFTTLPHFAQTTGSLLNRSLGSCCVM